MGFLRSNLVSLLDSTFNHTSSLLGSMSRAMDEWDAETQLARLESKSESLMKSGSKMFSGIGELLRSVRENSNLFVVRVPFDENKEEIRYQIDGNVLSVTKTSSTKNSKSESVTTATIPDDCNIEGLQVAYNKDKKIMAYVFPKAQPVTETEEPTDDGFASVAD